MQPKLARKLKTSILKWAACKDPRIERFCTLQLQRSSIVEAIKGLLIRCGSIRATYNSI